MASLAKYKYLGMSAVVEVDYPEPQVKLDLWGGTPGTYTGIDQFGRIIDHRWINYGADPAEDVARIKHGYDRNSNRLWRQNDVARALSKKFDQQYTYDGLNRLVDAKTGLLDGSKVIPPGSDTTFQQQWSLDYVGNWSGFNQDDDGDGDFDLKQTRTGNEVNEITAIGATTGPVWTTPVYDAAGNTTNFPKPAVPTESFTAVYDAWNRMVRVTDDESDDDTVQENVYDGRNFRIVKKTYDGGELDETRHAYFTANWQNIEERLEEEPDFAEPESQFIWGIRQVDDLILRNRDTSIPADGLLNEPFFAIQDPNWNITAIVDNTGNLQERYEYESYGSPLFFDEEWGSQYDTAFQWTVMFASYVFDERHGSYLVRERNFDCSLGIWLNRDFILSDLNLYNYVFSNPARWVDPRGLNPINPNRNAFSSTGVPGIEGQSLDATTIGTYGDWKGLVFIPPTTTKEGGISVSVGAIRTRYDILDGNDVEKNLFEQCAAGALDGCAESTVGFVNILKKRVANCKASNPGPNAKCCISFLTIDGHTSAYFGGGFGLSEEQVNEVSDMMCPDADFMACGCAVLASSSNAWVFARILAKKGGSFQATRGWAKGLCGKNATFGTPMMRIEVPAQATIDLMRSMFELAALMSMNASHDPDYNPYAEPLTQ